jgi:predicted aldo/keto reductase-like oxidoreductase
MIYKDFQGIKLSCLGLGAMRLPTVGERGPIDEAKARELIEYAYGQGVNYFDTAYRYHSGNSETFLSSVLQQYPRDTWYLATKMPGHMMQYKNGRITGIGYLEKETIASPAQIFEDQLKRCGVDYFDFYLLHNVCETAWDFYTNQELGVVEYLVKQKQAGRIRHLGFSAHGRAETIDKFLSLYKCFEFVQIQLNYMDWVLQDAGKKYEVITKHGLPVISMESCRGGKLASLNAEADAMLKAARPNDSTVSWAFRFLQSLPNVSVVLSGMTSMEQLVENIALFSKDDPTTAQDNEMLRRVVDTMADLVPCTGCAYCTEACPQNLDIPKLISMGNEMRFDNPFVLKFTLDAMTEKELPSACIACAACSQLCPQGIDIPSVLKQFAQALEKF